MTETGIYVTSITPPADYGWITATHCDICKTTVFVFNPWAIKPSNGDYWILKHTCVNEQFMHQHNLNMWWEESGHHKFPMRTNPNLPLGG